MSFLAESATLDVLDSYDGRDSSMTEQESVRRPVEHPIPLRASTPERTMTLSSCNSTSDLIAVHNAPSRIKSPCQSSFFHENLPSRFSTLEGKRKQVVQNAQMPTRFWHGWKVIVFGSCTLCQRRWHLQPYTHADHETRVECFTGRHSHISGFSLIYNHNS